MQYKRLNLILTACVAALGLAALPASAENPYVQPDGTWISISGTVQEVWPDSFSLDYGEGLVTVEMDDGDRDADAYKLALGDRVTVNGMVDDDFFETTTIEAASVYVENIGTEFYSSAVDEEDLFVRYSTPILVTETVLQGIVTKVEPGQSEFLLFTGSDEIRVEVESMAYDPLDNKGYQKVEVGDLVRVTGNIDDGLFQGREFEADSIITLSS